MVVRLCSNRLGIKGTCSTHIEEMFGDSHILKSLKHLGETPKVLCIIDCVNKQEFN